MQIQCVIPAKAGIHLAYEFATSPWIPAFAGMTNLTASITKSAIARKFCIAAHHRLGIGRETADRARHRIAPGDAARVHRPSSAHTFIAGRRRIAAVFIGGRRVTARARMRPSSKAIAPEGNREAPPSQRCAERQTGCGAWQGNKNTSITVYLGKFPAVCHAPDSARILCKSVRRFLQGEYEY